MALGERRPAPSPVPAAGGLIWGKVEKPDTPSQTSCVLCLREGTAAPLEHAYIIGGYSLCMRHTQAFFEARQSPDNFIASYVTIPQT